MGNSSKQISELVEEVDRHDLVLPEMQRRYVWRSTQVRDLFDSLYRGYPVGTVLVWERPEGEEGRELDVGETAGARRQGQKLLLLDGQQRLTSLTSIIKDRELLVVYESPQRRIWGRPIWRHLSCFLSFQTPK